MNAKVEYAIKVLLEYKNENQLATARDTSDLSPLEQWLIIRLFSLEKTLGSI